MLNKAIEEAWRGAPNSAKVHQRGLSCARRNYNRASHNDYEYSFLPTGLMGGIAEDALDTACGLNLGDPTAWT